MKQPGEILLVACYELGHQPLALASPLGLLAEAGYQPASVDLSVEPPEALSAAAARARLVAISSPMHTALRLGVPAAERVRQINPSAHICFYGLYAWLNAAFLLEGTADSVIAGEFEQPLMALADALERGEPSGAAPGVVTRERAGAPFIERIHFAAPRRESLPGLERYAHLAAGGELRTAGYVEASRGCLHVCRHCPITPVYGGRFFVVPAETVLADARAQVRAGARHITFGDPDFLNGPGHSLKIARALHAEFPNVTFDFTAKVEHLLEQRRLLPELVECGAAFAVSAFESTSDVVLEKLDKGHTRADMVEALQVAAEAGLPLRPSLVAFTPWTTLDDYLDMLEFVGENGLIDLVDPVQFSIRLLVPPGSALAAQPDAAEWLGELDAPYFTYRWDHPDPRMDALWAMASARVEQAAQMGEAARVTFEAVRGLAYAAAGQRPPAREWPQANSRTLPRLTEAWFCCAEPTEGQFELISNGFKRQSNLIQIE
jgi:radical SAM superfamily enzyme YgiQ (UPF0313 family)